MVLPEPPFSIKKYMAKGMTFQAVLKLQKQQFDQGIKSVQKSLNSLKSTFMQVAGALGAGLGLNALISNMRTTATQLSVVKNTLENVSETTTEYAQSLEFLKKIANEYGQNQNSLIGSFAKFKAAAAGAGVQLDEIKRIYESMTRAAGAYHLSAEQTQNVMMAVEQMFSKGKVTAEELRRQLGNALPGAFVMMAKAAGEAGVTVNGTTAELEAAMKAGRVLAADVLPEFAKILDETTRDANFDSLQSSLNRFQNSWINFVEKTGFENTFKGLVDNGTKALDTLSNNFILFRHLILDISTTIIAGLGFDKMAAKGRKSFGDLKKSSESLKAQIADVSLETAKMQVYLEQIGTSGHLDRISAQLSEEWLLSKNINTELIQEILYLESIEKGKGAALYADIERQVVTAKINSNEKQCLVLTKQLSAASKQLAREGSFIRTVWQGISVTIKSATAALKGMLAATGWGLLVGVMMELVQLAWDWVKGLMKGKEEVEDVVSKAKEINQETGKQIAEVEQLGRRYKEITKEYEKEKKLGRDTTKIENQRKGMLSELNRLLGLNNEKMLTLQSTAGEVNSAIEKWATSIKIAAQQMGVMQEIGRLTASAITLNGELEELQNDPNYGKKNPKGTRTIPSGGGNAAYTVQTGGGLTREAQELANREQEIKDSLKKIEGQKKKLEEAADDLALAAIEAAEAAGSGSTVTTPAITGATKELQKALDDYQAEAQRLENQKQRGAISEEEYQESLKKTQKSTYKTIAGYENLEDILKKLPPKYAEMFSSLEDIFAQLKLDESVEEAFNMAQEQLKKSTDELMDNLERYWKEEDKILKKGIPEREKRDSFFDYKKSNADILGEKAGISEDWLKDLTDLKDELIELKNSTEGGLSPVLQDFLDMVLEKLKEAGAEAKDLRTKANVAQWQEDVKKLKQELSDLKYDSFKNIAGSFDRLVSGIESVKNAMEDLGKSDANFLDILKAVITLFNEGIQIVDTYKSVIEGVHKVEEAYQKYVKASTDKQALDSAKQVATQELVAKEEEKSATATVMAEETKQAAINKTTTAQVDSAVAGAASSQAGIPILGPILAAAAVAGIVGLLASKMKKYATGGIIGGSYTQGDRQIARVNSGEMILNKAQQAHLFNMISGKEGGSGGNVEFKIRGADLVGAINNYQSRRRG